MKTSRLVPILLVSILLFQGIPFSNAKDSDETKNFTKIEIRNKRPSSNFKEGEIIVKFKKDKINLKKNSGKSKAKSFEAANELKELNSANKLNSKLFKSDKKTEDLIEELKKDPNVEYAEPNFIRFPLSMPNDTYFNYQWALNNTGQTFQSSTGATISGTIDADIDAAEAWSTENSSNQEIIVAVIDTGARLSHEDITSNIWTNTGEIAGNGIDDDNNGYIDDVHGWDFKDNDNNPDDSVFQYCYTYAPDNITCLDQDDVSGHGTFISGIIAGIQGNSKGISGISSKNKIKVMPIRFDLDLDTELQAIQYAKDNGAKVINASFGAATFSQSEKNSIDAFTGLFVTAAGNDGTNNDISHYYPSDYTSSNLISVAATDENDSLAIFSSGGSNYGATSIDLGAPGKNITSVYNTSDIAYAVGDGTSFATPYVAASTAMLFSVDNLLSTSSVKNILLSSGDSLSSLSGKTVSGKRLNLNSAIQAASKVTTPIASPVGGTYSSTQTVTLSTETSGASIYYTLDGTTPTASSTLYSAPLNISTTATLKAIAIKAGMTNSDAFSSIYTITIAAPVQVTPPVDDAAIKAADYDLYQKYLGYQKYEKYKNYQKYKKAKSKYGFKNSGEKAKYKQSYTNFKLFLKNPIRYRQYATLMSEYKKYKKYLSGMSSVKKYSKYSKYNKKGYANYKNYGSAEYRDGYARYLAY